MEKKKPFLKLVSRPGTQFVCRLRKGDVVGVFNGLVTIANPNYPPRQIIRTRTGRLVVRYIKLAKGVCHFDFSKPSTPMKVVHEK